MKNHQTQYEGKVDQILKKKTFCDTRGLFYKSFTIVNYDCNDSGQYYKPIMLGS
jgi:hypothetical protein